MSVLNQLLAALKVEANVFHNGQYCGMWAIDTSGRQRMTFHVVSHGACRLQVGEQIMELHQGDVVFLPSDSTHRASGLSSDDDIDVNRAQSTSLVHGLETDGTGLVCGYFDHQNPVFDHILMQLPEVIVLRAAGDEDKSSATTQVVQLILQESVSSGQSTNLLLNRLADCLLYLLLRDHVDVNTSVFSGLIHPKLNSILELIHGEPEKKWNVDELAQVAGMSRSAFSRLFKERVGLSPMDYLTQWRMTLAYRYLADDGISTLDAALRCGYESEASFSKAFKRVMGVGPGQVRRKELA